MTLYPDDNTSPNGEPEVGLHNGKFTNGDPTNGIKPSRAWAPHTNLLTDLLERVISGTQTGGSARPPVVVNNTNVNQLLNAIRLIHLPVGEIRLFAYHPTQLPFGWHQCNGASFLLSSPIGQALNTIEPGHRGRWGMLTDTSNSDPTQHTIKVPDLEDYFPRIVNGVNTTPGARDVGNKQDWAIENIKGHMHAVSMPYPPDGLFCFEYYETGSIAGGVTRPVNQYSFDTSRVVKTADETRPKNVGFTAAVWLNV